MPTKVEKDAVTGVETTGHEWDGIKELNKPLPKWWLYVLYATIAWSVVWWVLYPSWPGISGYFGGHPRLRPARGACASGCGEANAERAVYLERLEGAELGEIADDPELMSIAFTGGEAAFADNCAPCHGLGGAGAGLLPDARRRRLALGRLARGDPPDHPLRHAQRPSRHPHQRDAGVRRARHADPRADRRRRRVRAADLRAGARRGGGRSAARRSSPSSARPATARAARAARTSARPTSPISSGSTAAPSATSCSRSTTPRHGVMPAWTGRLDPETIKSLAVYVHALGGGR